MKKIKYILLSLSFVSPLAAGEIYKCQSLDGKLSFSNSPCQIEAQEKIVKFEKTDWITRLKRKGLSRIQIVEVTTKDGDTTIKYNFKSIPDSARFMKLANDLSHMPVVLMKIIMPEGKTPGRAEILASKKPNSVLDMLIESPVKGHPITLR